MAGRDGRGVTGGASLGTPVALSGLLSRGSRAEPGLCSWCGAGGRKATEELEEGRHPNRREMTGLSAPKAASA